MVHTFAENFSADIMMLKIKFSKIWNDHKTHKTLKPNYEFIIRRLSFAAQQLCIILHNTTIN